MKEIKLLNVFIEKNLSLKKINKNKDYLNDHLKLRDKVEEDFFKLYNDSQKKKINLTLVKKKNYYNSQEFINKIKLLKPDLIIVFGSSIIKGEIINIYKDRIINLHLGLSPYYRGSGTNYFALVNNKPELFGSTIMFLNRGIDTGKIIHQLRPKMLLSDNIHIIGNRLIIDSVKVIKKIILNYDKIKKKTLSYKNKNSRVFKRTDFNEKSLDKLKKNFKSGMLLKYLKNKKKRDSKYKIIQQKFK